MRVISDGLSHKVREAFFFLVLLLFVIKPVFTHFTHYSSQVERVLVTIGYRLFLRFSVPRSIVLS